VHGSLPRFHGFRIRLGTVSDEVVHRTGLGGQAISCEGQTLWQYRGGGVLGNRGRTRDVWSGTMASVGVASSIVDRIDEGNAPIPDHSLVGIIRSLREKPGGLVDKFQRTNVAAGFLEVTLRNLQDFGEFLAHGVR
jgi:hypothetical protein